jgi:UDP-sulfoquinovose synthase
VRVLILGGDGYLGWPTAMHLSRHGHDVTVLDNYFARKVVEELDLPYLFPVPDLKERVAEWRHRTGKEIGALIGDATDPTLLREAFERVRPEAVVHYAEQPSAPYSMLGQREALFTLQNNLTTTLNVAYAVRDAAPGCHIIKLGTMGEYGTPNIDIEEGWLDIEHKGRKDRFLFPRQAGSLYHTTKVNDTDLLYFYVRTWALAVTDLMQGPVYGLFTDEMDGDVALASHFSYDEVFGTVLNRFIVQAVAGVPLTVYGKGGQTRGYLNIRDTMQCVRLAVENPAKAGEMRIYNQFTETFSVNDLGRKVKDAAGTIGIDVEIRNIENPRVEAEEHYYNPVHHGLRELGLEPHPLTGDVLVGMLEAARRHSGAIRDDIILPRAKWK